MSKKEKPGKKEESKQESKKELGITVGKDELSEWFVQLLQKAELIEYTKVSGCYILRPRAYFIWEQVRDYFDKKINAGGTWS